MPFRSLELGMPLSVRAEVEPAWANNPARRIETFPRWQIVKGGFMKIDAAHHPALSPISKKFLSNRFPS